MNTKQFGVMGLGRMGGGVAQLAMRKGYEVVGYDPYPSDAIKQSNVTLIADPKEFIAKMTAPRRIFMWVAAGKLVDELADQLAEVLEPGDIIVDGGNSYWGDSKRRAEYYASRGLHFVDLGTSGGVEGALNAPCFMVGGDDEAVALIEPILKDLCIQGGYVHAGGSGTGHYTKLVHNGIEFGMLQAIGEGMDLLTRFPEKLAIKETLECWRNGSVIRSWLIDLMARAYGKDAEMRNTQGYIEDTGEVNWLVSDAMTMDIPIPVIAQAIMMIIKSRDVLKTADKAIIEMRHEFGGHPFGPLTPVRDERVNGRIGDIYKFEPRPVDKSA